MKKEDIYNLVVIVFLYIIVTEGVLTILPVCSCSSYQKNLMAQLVSPFCFRRSV